MALNSLQHEILTTANKFVGENVYPHKHFSKLGNIDDDDFFRKFSTEVEYLESHGLVEVTWSKQLYKFRRPHSFRISAKGRDSFSEKTAKGRDYLNEKSRLFSIKKILIAHYWKFFIPLAAIVIAAIILVKLGINTK